MATASSGKLGCTAQRHCRDGARVVVVSGLGERFVDDGEKGGLNSCTTSTANFQGVNTLTTDHC